MRKPSSVIALLPVLLALSGCLQKESSFEVTRAGSQSLLLNKATGEISLIEGATLVRVRPVEKSSSAPAARSWPEQKPSGVPGVTISVRTKYRDGNMLYIVEASPYEGALGKAKSAFESYATFTLKILDAEGFSVSPPIDLKISDSLRVVDNEGKPSLLHWSGSQAMSAEAYGEAAILTVGWRGFPAGTKE